MDIYQEKSNWKAYLVIMGILILTASLIYTTTVANKLAEEERKKVEIFAEAILNVSDTTQAQCDLSFELKNIAGNTTIPVILIEESGTIQEGRNYGEEKDFNFDFLEKKLEKLKSNGYPPVPAGEGNLIYYEDSTTLKMLTYFHSYN